MAWDYNKAEYDKQAKADPVWALERKILYGLKPGERLDEGLIVRYLDELNIPEQHRAFLRLITNS